MGQLGKRPSKKSFRQIAFSAMVGNSGLCASKNNRAADRDPIFKFNLRPPTADPFGGKNAPKQRRYRFQVSDFEDSSESWTSDGGGDSDAGDSDGSTKKQLQAARYGVRCSQKLSVASVGVNVREQLRDLRIIVGTEEIHISGLNVIRMLNNVPWAPQETQDFRALVFHGLDLDQVLAQNFNFNSIFNSIFIQFLFNYSISILNQF